MLKTGKLGLNLPEGSDPLSVRPLNENFVKLDDAVRVVRGSYVGSVAAKEPESGCDYYDRNLTRSFGEPNSGDEDVNIVLKFRPRLFFLTGCRENETAWPEVTTGYTGADGPHITTTECRGMEYQLFSLTAAEGQILCPAQLRSRYPFAGLDEKNCFAFEWRKGEEQVFCRVETVDNGDGTWTLSVRGTNEQYGTVNWADVEGMTYHWTAIG